MKDIVTEFISRRFSKDSNWCNGNCYYFALILKDRFNGSIYYEPIMGHFITKIDNVFYDWHGVFVPERLEVLVKWDGYEVIDSLHYARIKEDCLG